ncbi:MAG TPA: M56 family metallopeptidase, partial [Thermoanaerobaculia bacterium]|nr:M56 family metallopeptidase [Thermoanaerobaculia bacterium]
PAASTGGVRRPGAAGATQKQEIGARGDDGESSLGTAISVARAIVPAEPLSAIDRATNVVRVTWKGLIVLTVFIGALLMLVHMALGMAGVWFVARHATPLEHDDALRELDAARDQLALGFDVRLLRSSRITVPVVWGFFRPVLLLPTDVVTWPAERLRVVLLHELAHLKRFDGISLLLTRAAVSLFWFHPLAWSLERHGRSECERACDDLVLVGGTKPSEYADHLLAIARSMPSFDPFRSVTLAMSRKSQLEGRLLSILQPGVARRVFSGRGIAIACALAIAVIVPVAALRLTAEPSKETPKPAPKPAQAEITVTPEMEKIGDYLLAKLGKYDERADKFATTPENGEEWYERAYDLYRADRYTEAAAAFERSAQQGHAEAKSLYNAACSYALAGDRANAITTLRAAIDAGWDDFDKIADDSDFDQLRGDPAFARAINDTRGDIATRRVTRTIERYTRLRDSGTRDGDAWFEVGLDLLSLRRLDEAIDAFDNAIAAGEKTSASMYNIACAHSLRGDVRSGLAALDKAIENGYSGDRMKTDPDIALLRQQPQFAGLAEKAEDLELRGSDWEIAGIRVSNWREGVEHHRRMTQKYPNSGRAWFNAGYASLQARQFPAAIEAFQRTIAMHYRVGTSSYNIACAYALQGDRDAAFAWLGKAKAANFELEDHLDHDSDLDSLHRDPRWKTFTSGLVKHEKHHWKKH